MTLLVFFLLLIIIGSPRVPERVRQALKVEAGLNDVLLSIFVHGLSAQPGIALYARNIKENAA